MWPVCRGIFSTKMIVLYYVCFHFIISGNIYDTIYMFSDVSVWMSNFWKMLVWMESVLKQKRCFEICPDYCNVIDISIVDSRAVFFWCLFSDLLICYNNMKSLNYLNLESFFQCIYRYLYLSKTSKWTAVLGRLITVQTVIRYWLHF